jgi:hypothetical protein
LVKGGVPNASEGETSIRALHVLALDHEDFDPVRFSGVLSQFSGNLAQTSAPAGVEKK